MRFRKSVSATLVDRDGRPFDEEERERPGDEQALLARLDAEDARDALRASTPRRRL